MIIITGITLTPSTVNVRQPFLCAVSVIEAPEIPVWYSGPYVSGGYMLL